MMQLLVEVLANYLIDEVFSVTLFQLVGFPANSPFSICN